MDPAGGGAGAPDQNLSDIQTYLASFNKEISDGGQPAANFQMQGQEFILQQGDNLNNITFYQGDGTTYTDGESQNVTVVTNRDGTTQLVVHGPEPPHVVQHVMKEENHKEEGSFVQAPTLEAEVVHGEVSTPDHVDQPLLTPAAPSYAGEHDEETLQHIQLQGTTTAINVTPHTQPIISHSEQGTILTIEHDSALEHTDSSETAVQVLASVAATTIPEAQINEGMVQDAQLVAVQNDQDSSQPQLVAVQNTHNVSEPQIVSVQDMASTAAGISTQAGSSQQMLTVSSDQGQQVIQASGEDIQGGDQQPNSVILNTGSSYQTVTIVPSEVSQGGEVSYVLIVSQPDVDPGRESDSKANLSMDMSVYDFKEEARQVGDEESDSDEEGGTPKKIIRVTPKKTAAGMQAQLMCNYCNYTSPKRYLLTRHMKTHSEERPHKCNICDRGFKTVASLQNHINTHTGVRPHKCKECESSFTTSGELVRHVRYRHTYEKPHKCTECDYCSVELSKLKRHMRSHTGERPYQCPHCSYASPDTYKLKRHLRIHTGEKPYECNVCHARFTQSNSLKAHKLIHTGNKPVFQCELCPTTCGRKTDLKIHVQKLHTSEKPLQCKKCGKSFPDRYTYKIHLKTHEGEKCFKCELCPYAALSQRHLESHILTHTGEKPFQCDECDQSFRQKQLLKRHKNLYHTPDYMPPPPKEKTHECSECHKSFAHRGNLLRHMAMHDPDNPEYHIKAEEYSSGEEEEDESDFDENEVTAPGDPRGIVHREPQVQYVQVHEVLPEGTLLSTADGQQVTQIEDGTTPKGRRGSVRATRLATQQVQLQLVTEDGQNAGQILLQMEGHDEVEEEEEEEEENEPPEVVEVTPAKRGRGRPPRAQVVQQPQEEEVEEEEEKQEEEEEEEEVVEVPKKSPRGRGRPPKSPAAATPPTPTKGRRRTRSTHQEEPDEEEQEPKEEEEEEVPVTPRRGRRRQAETTPEAAETPSKKMKKEDDDEKRREEQKKKDIEECFGFDVEEEET